jgi:hypothetical protein
MSEHDDQYIDAGDLRRYRTEIPNIIDESDLSVFAFRLYAHLKRVAGDSGACWKSTKTLAAACKMSTGQIVKAKNELEEFGFIKIKSGNKAVHESDTITIVDLWPENMQRFKARSCGERENEKPRSCGEPKKEHIQERTYVRKNEDKKKHTHDLDARPREATSLPESEPPQQRVCVNKSKFSIQERRSYAENQAGITNKDGWLITSEDGRFDYLVEVWASKQGIIQDSPIVTDFSLCPDCHGSGTYYPEGFSQGVKKCRHEKLTRKDKAA